MRLYKASAHYDLCSIYWGKPLVSDHLQEVITTETQLSYMYHRCPSDSHTINPNGKKIEFFLFCFVFIVSTLHSPLNHHNESDIGRHLSAAGSSVGM